MKTLQKELLAVAAILGFALASQATVIVDDTWATATSTNWNLPNRCPWYYYDNTNKYMFAATNALYCTNYNASVTGLRYWWTFFATNDPALTVPMLPLGTTNNSSNDTNVYHGHPVDLQQGQMIKFTLKFTPTGFLMDGSKTRFGLFSYDQADEGTVTRSSKMFGKSGTNVTGYYVQVPIQATFPGNNLFSVRCRTNLNEATGLSTEPMGKDDIFWSLGGGAPITNASGFLLDNQYTLEISVARYASSNVITGAISGNLGGVVTNYTHSRVDVSGRNWHKFDCFAIRFDSSFPSPDVLILNQFKVEVLPIDFTVTGDRINADSYRLTFPTWPGFTYQAQSKDDLNALNWDTFDAFTASDHTGVSTNTGTTGINGRFYRVVNTPP